MGMMKLYENPGWGSAIVEAQLAVLGLPCELIPAGDIVREMVREAERTMERIAAVRR